MGLNNRIATTRREALFHSEPWYRAYMSALFETDTALIGPRIALAERLIAVRQLERFNAGIATTELRALNHAFLALQALRMSPRQISAGRH